MEQDIHRPFLDNGIAAAYCLLCDSYFHLNLLTRMARTTWSRSRSSGTISNQTGIRDLPHSAKVS